VSAHDFIFTSYLEAGRREELDRMLFHNRNQPKVYDGAVGMIERYQTPRISAARGRLWITFDSGAEAQTLFALERGGAAPQLVGVLVYTREDDALAVVLLAVDEDYARGGRFADRNLFFAFLKEIEGIARRIKGIASIKFYLTTPPKTISVGGRGGPGIRFQPLTL